MAEKPSDERARARDEDLLVAALDELHRRYSDPSLTGKKVAEAIGVSEKTLFRLFVKERFGAALLNLRMEHAERLLEEGRHSVATVARLSGFSSASAFSVHFKAMHDKVSPGAWRVAKGGRVRAGPPTGAFDRPAERARARREGKEFAGRPRRDAAGESAVFDAELREASARLHARGVKGVSIADLTREIYPELYAQSENDEVA